MPRAAGSDSPPEVISTSASMADPLASTDLIFLGMPYSLQLTGRHRAAGAAGLSSSILDVNGGSERGKQPLIVRPKPRNPVSWRNRVSSFFNPYFPCSRSAEKSD